MSGGKTAATVLRADERDGIIDRCSRRTEFQLSYTRSREPRLFHEDGITGADIEDAYEAGRPAPGDWSNGGALYLDHGSDQWTEGEVLQQFFTDAISEAVHEALEWFLIDGKRPLDPHHFATESAIYAASREFAHKLWAMARLDAGSGEQQ